MIKGGKELEGFQSLLEGKQDLICWFHGHELQAHQCGSVLLQQVKVPVEAVWAVLRRFDEPQAYKRFIQRCEILEGDGGVGTVREVHLVSSIPATSSVERLEILDEERHVISFRVLGGGHRLQNYWSVTSLHAHEIDGQLGTLVLESYVVDIPEGNTREETHLFVDTVVRCNLKSLAQVSQQKFHLSSRHIQATKAMSTTTTAPLSHTDATRSRALHTLEANVER
jgi:abscisic acid receptor (PYR/PYL family)